MHWNVAGRSQHLGQTTPVERAYWDFITQVQSGYAPHAFSFNEICDNSTSTSQVKYLQTHLAPYGYSVMFHHLHNPGFPTACTAYGNAIAVYTTGMVASSPQLLDLYG
jgi:hypothetical protein